MKKAIKCIGYGLLSIFIIVVGMLLVLSPQSTPSIASAHGIAVVEDVLHHGAMQRIVIRGQNINNPVLLHLHGGPGAPDHAPIEAFPGVSLGGRLCVGAVKALASSLFGGQSFSEELTKNLFNEIGGEIFPKLVGNDFTGNRINDLTGKGL